MDSVPAESRPEKRKRRKKRKKAKEQAVLSIISVRLTDEEKERIDEIMRVGNFKRYSDVVRMAIHMYRAPGNGEYDRPDIYH